MELRQSSILAGNIAHFLDMEYKHCTVLLGLPRVFGSHGGYNIADSILSVTACCKITDNLGCFVMDNASINDKMMEALQKAAPSIDKNSVSDVLGTSLISWSKPSYTAR